MRRKSERNKTKATPEKKVEKVTRKSTRRTRGRTSPSPDNENAEDTTSRDPCIPEEEEDNSVDLPTHQGEQNPSELIKSVLTGGEEAESGGSVWKVARADASPGEIQKLKLCRQRNVSETSDGSAIMVSGKKIQSNKWSDSGEGVPEEADSADDQLAFSISKSSTGSKVDDPSSSWHPSQEYSVPEVSDHTENLTETTEANLSDDKQNVDWQQQQQQPEHIQEVATTDYMNNVDAEFPETYDEDQLPQQVVFAEESETSNSLSQVIYQQIATEDEEEEKQEVYMDFSSALQNQENVSDKGKSPEETKEESDNTQDTKSTMEQEEPRKSGRKSHSKYQESSPSDTQESEDEKVETNGGSKTIDAEVEHTEINAEKEDVLEINEKVEDITTTPAAPVPKPAKVSLKRTFTRVSTDSEVKKKDEKDTSEGTESTQNKENHNNVQENHTVTKRRRWGTVLTTNDSGPAVSISTDSLKKLVPGAKPLSLNELRLTKEVKEDSKARRFSRDSESDASKEEQMENHSSRRKVILKEPVRRRSPSIELPTTNILLIKNLVRPFTVIQIKELLSRTGTIQENGFWMDKIKSKCFVEYANEDQAFETRQALHGISWPSSNPKKLIVEYSTKEDMDRARQTSVEQPISRKTELLYADDMWQDWTQETRNNMNMVREWDLGKDDNHTNLKDKQRERREAEKRRRPRSPEVEIHLPAPARKFKKKEEEPPTAKLLDDLFKKTKATPCIYWLPLTNEQILVKEEMRRQHMAEHARRLEQIRAERERRDRERDRERDRRRDKDRDRRGRRSPRK